MTYKTILSKNSLLTTKLLEFLANNPEALKHIPSGVSYVAFSATDKELNKFNSKLLKQLKDNGKKVVQAVETNDTKNPWELNYMSA